MKKTINLHNVDPTKQGRQEIGFLGYTAEALDINSLNKEILEQAGIPYSDSLMEDIQTLKNRIKKEKEKEKKAQQYNCDKIFIIRDKAGKFLYLNAELLNEHQEPRAKETTIDTLIMHATVCNFNDTMVVFYDAINPETSEKIGRVSSHYIITKDGIVLTLVPEKARAWHAGKSFWRGKETLNENSIGIEVVNNLKESGNWDEYSKQQTDTLIHLANLITAVNENITPYNVVAHSDVSPGRKFDPGLKFPWQELAEKGIGIKIPSTDMQDVSVTSVICSIEEKSQEVSEMQKLLSNIGYNIEKNGVYDEKTQHTVQAFKTHYTPDVVHDKESTPEEAKKAKRSLTDVSLEGAGKEWTTLCNAVATKVLSTIQKDREHC